MSLKKLTMAFSGGEVTPEFWGQIGDAKFQTGLATARNALVLPHGPVQNRPGFAYVAAVKTAAKRTRVIPFRFSTTQTMVLELGEGYIRFHTQGAPLITGTVAAYSGTTHYSAGDLALYGSTIYYCKTDTYAVSPPDTAHWYALAGQVYEVPTTYTEAEVFDVHFVQSADVLTLVHPNHPPAELRRLGALKWVLADIVFSSTLPVPPGAAVTANLASSPSNLIPYNYAVTSVGATGQDESGVSLPATGSNIVVTGITSANPAVITTGTAHGVTAGQTIVLLGAVMGTHVLDGAYTVDTVLSTTTLTLRQGTTILDTSTFPAYYYGAALRGTGVQNNLLQTGAYNIITWTSTGAPLYNVYKQSNGLWGYIGQTNATTFKDDNITANLGITPPILANPFGSSGYYPGAVSYFEQRRVFAGSVNEPQTMRMTRSGTESSLAYSVPTKDDDAVTAKVAAREANTIRHLVPMTMLVMLTGAAEWRAVSANGGAITPSSIDVKPQSYVGANNVQPVVVNNNIVYCAARGGHVREMAYSYQAGGYITGDVSLRAPHLFRGFQIVDMAFAKTPVPIVWCVSSTGKLLGFTYVPEQQVGAWHQHDTDGVFESCCLVEEGDEDALYTVVRRTIGGASVRYVERMHTREFTAQADAFFVDCGATYSGAPATTISGLAWLEGKTVSVLGDGAVFPPKVVTGGAITLEHACSKVQVGLPYTCDILTLPLSAQVDAAYGQGRTKSVNRIWARVVSSSGWYVGPNADQLVRFKQRTTEPPGTPPALVSDEFETVLDSTWQTGGQVLLRQTDPLPFTLSSITVEAELGG